jgi:Transposase IS116/IS110/IS902 family
MPRPGFGVSQIVVLAGVAPIDASSAGEVRHRLSGRGNRRLNMLVYLIALAQQRSYAPAQAHMARRQHEGVHHVKPGVPSSATWSDASGTSGRHAGPLLRPPFDREGSEFGGWLAADAAELPFATLEIGVDARLSWRKEVIGRIAYQD